jgi:cyclopropane-fatty-acyl-phospholipid synthase
MQSARIENVCIVRVFIVATCLKWFIICHTQRACRVFVQWKTVAGRSKTYTEQVGKLLGDKVHLSTPIKSVVKKDGRYELQTFCTNGDARDDHNAASSPVNILFDQVIFACHPPTASAILQEGAVLNIEDDLAKCLSEVHYADNVVYVHSDPTLMPQRRRAWASWNCLGQSHLLFNATRQLLNRKAQHESFEGGASGFGSKMHQNGTTNSDYHQVTDGSEQLEGKEGRMKAVYVTYWLNRLQNLKTEQDIFVSLNPHHRPDPELTHKRVVMAHPQFTPATLTARSALHQFQGKGGLWFCGAWQGYGFHEDGCRSGFEVATQLSNIPLPWCNSPNQTQIESGASTDKCLLVLPPPNLAKSNNGFGVSAVMRHLYKKLTYDLPVALCKPWILYFLKQAVQKGRLRLKSNDGTVLSFGDGSQAGLNCDSSPVTIRIFDDWFYVKTALEYDLGLARAYMAGYFAVEALDGAKLYDPVVRPLGVRDEFTTVLGDPVGLVRLFLLFIANRDHPDNYRPRKARSGHWYSNAMTNASGLIISRIGSFFNFLRYKLTMNNSEGGGSLKNIHSHYDLSNDLFTTFLDKETLMYSSAIYDAVKAPAGRSGLVFRGTLEQAQWRKLDTLLDRAQVRAGQTLLDIGFGWGGLSIRAAQKYGCRVTGITLSVEQKALADERVEKEGLQHLITFEVVDYRIFARRSENQGRFDRVLSCEMIEAVGHEHLGEFFWAVEQVLKHDGILVMEAITTPEQRYETYRRSTDFINTIIFPGSCCPSLHALVDAAYQQSCLTLERIDNIGLHYARTLAEWRRRFNASEEVVRKLGFDDVFLRVWNYYLTYCEAGFHSQTENCLILVFARQGCGALVSLCETRSIIQAPALTDTEIQNWLTEAA